MEKDENRQKMDSKSRRKIVHLVYERPLFVVKTSAAPLIGDQLLSSASALGTSANRKNRSRHCSANSAKSCVSFDSAIGDVYSVQTPTKMNKNSSHHNELDIFDFSPNTTASTSTSSTSPSTVLGKKNAQWSAENLFCCIVNSKCSFTSIFHLKSSKIHRLG